MKLFSALQAIARQFWINFIWITVLVAGQIMAARQVNLMIRPHLLGVKLHRRRHVAHGIPTPADVAGDGRATVAQLALVYIGLIRLQEPGFG